MRAGAAIVLALVFSAAVAAEGGSITAKHGAIDVHARQVPIGALLKELGTLVPLDVVAVDPALPSRLVDVDLDDVPLDMAAGRLLLETNCVFIVGGLKGQPLRVVLGSSDPAHLARAAVASAGAVAGGDPRADAEQGGAATPGSDDVRERLADMRRDMAERAQAREAELAVVSDAQREAEQIPIEVWDDPKVDGGYSMVGESVAYHDPNFVPYKNRPEVRARRLASDVSKIP